MPRVEQQAPSLIGLVEELRLVTLAERVRRRRNTLYQEVKIKTLEQQLATLRRRRNKGTTLASLEAEVEEEGYTQSQAPSACSTHARRRLPNRLQLKEPNTFKGKTLKEAYNFIQSLELVFALLPNTYQEDREKVLYRVMFFASELRKTWHQNYSVSELASYTQANFLVFVQDAVKDPINYSLSVIVAYEAIKQGENQIV